LRRIAQNFAKKCATDACTRDRIHSVSIAYLVEHCAMAPFWAMAEKK